MIDDKHYCADDRHRFMTTPLATRKVWLDEDEWTGLCTAHAKEAIKYDAEVRVESFAQPGVPEKAA